MRNCASEDALRRRTLGVRAEGRHTVITAIGVIAALFVGMPLVLLLVVRD